MKTLCHQTVPVMFLCMLNACCPSGDYYSISMFRYEKAAAIITTYKEKFLRYENKYAKKGFDEVLISVNETQFKEITEQENSKEFNDILQLWADGLLTSENGALEIYRNGNIYFEIRSCPSRIDYVVYDGGEKIDIDVQSDIRKYRIKPSWIYVKMMK
jgi:hypothetical protein